jgi:hypothetical protein
MPFLPGTSLEPAMIPTAQVSSFRRQCFPYYVCWTKNNIVIYFIKRSWSGDRMTSFELNVKWIHTWHTDTQL